MSYMTRAGRSRYHVRVSLEPLESRCLLNAAGMGPPWPDRPAAAPDAAPPDPASVGDLVWNDVDGDGIQDAGEPGVPQARVQLIDASNRIVYQVLTSADGKYRLDSLSPGTYRIVFTAPGGYQITRQDQGADDAQDSDADPATGVTAPFTLLPGQSDFSRDAGMARPGLLRGSVWDDVNQDGLRQPGEQGAAGVALRLLDNALSTVATATTDANGSYIFGSLLPGLYMLEVAGPVAARFSPQDQGDDALDSDVDTATGRTAVFMIGQGQTASKDAGIYGTLAAARVGDRIWNDYNGNGVQDPGEAGIDGATVQLLNAQGAVLATGTSLADGSYAFAGLPAGEYSLRFVAPQGFSLSPMNQGGDDLLDSDANRSTGRTAPFRLITGQDDTSRDAGVFQTANAFVVKDIVPASASSGPNGLTTVGSTLYFSAYDPANGRELWKSDGTAAGTMLVKDIYPGGEGSNPQHLTNVGGTLFFVADDGLNGRELWKSDGTPEGTVLVADIRPGADGAAPAGLIAVSGTVFFTADDGLSGRELWKSDGTPEGTVMVTDVLPGPASSGLISLKNAGGTLFFIADDGTHGFELWKSDGTPDGTLLVLDIRSGTAGSQPQNLTNVGGTLFVTAEDGTHGRELWISDGTPEGTVLVKDLIPGPAGINLAYLTSVDGTLYVATVYASLGQLWKSNGTEAGTVLVKDFQPSGYGAWPMNLTDVGGTLFFSAYDYQYGYRLWKSDGTSAGTVPIADDSSAGFAFPPESLTIVGGTLYFRAAVWNDEMERNSGDELWRSDGTPEGTVMVEDIFPGILGSSPNQLTNVGGILFFVASDSTHGQELWKADPERLFFSPDVQSALRVTEIKYDWPNFIELKNIGHDVLDLRGTRFIDGIAFDFTSGSVTSLFPGEYLVLVDNLQYFYNSQYATTEINVAGEYRGGLENAGERLALVAPINKVIQSFTYRPGWFALTTFVGGFSLAVIDETADSGAWDDRLNWRPSSLQAGTPGAPDPHLTPDPGAVVISEIMSNAAANSDYDWIELHNTTNADVDLSGWFLDDDDTFTSYRMPPGTIIPNGGYLVFTRQDHFRFGLSSFGESARLTAGDKYSSYGGLLGYSESVSFGAAERDVSFGRHVVRDPLGAEHVDFVAMRVPTPGGANAAPKTGPVVINELMYHPAFLGDEFIELRNLTASPVDIGNWSMTGIGTVLEGTTIPGNGYLLVVPIDPAQFRTKYAIPAEVPIVGPYLGALNNAGEDVRLYTNQGVLIDGVEYDDQLPWPREADQGGGSLERLVPSLYGNDVINWKVTKVFGGTPGRANSVQAHPADANLDGKTDVSDLNVWVQYKFRDGTDWTRGDFNGDGKTDISDLNLWNQYKFTAAPAPLSEAGVKPRPSDKMDWLCQFDYLGTRRRAAVDRVLAAW